MATHAVENQPPPLADYDPYSHDVTLRQAVEREGGGWAHDLIEKFGRLVTTEEVYRWGFQANRFEPELHTHDRFGNRSDTVEFHPAWHSLMDLSISNGLHSLPFEKPPGEGARVVRDALFSLISQVESGHGCPISMTTSVPSKRERSQM